MKHYFYIITTTLLFLISTLSLKAQFLDYSPLSYQQSIKDGWYEASVVYHNTSTQYKAQYVLNVYVTKNTVSTISFGSNESVHSGYNNSGYSYYGGELNFEWDSEGNIIAASTKVEVYYLQQQNPSKQIFKIYIN